MAYLFKKLKSKKGFTLIELLAVIVVLAIVLIIAVPAIGKVIENVRNSAYLDDEKMMERAARTYVMKYPTVLPNEIGEKRDILLSDMINANVIEPIKDPKDKQVECTGKVVVKKISDKKYDYNAYLQCGDNYVTKGMSNFEIVALNNFGGSDSDYFNSVIADNDGNYVAVGYSYSDLSEYPDGSTVNGSDFVIAKFDSNLNLIKISNVDNTYYDYFSSVAVDNSGNYIAVGYTVTNNGECVIAKFDSNLNLIKKVNFGGTSYDEFTKVLVDAAGNYIAVGYSSSNLSGYTGGSMANSSNFVIAKFDSDLNVIKINNVGGPDSDSLKSVFIDKNGNYIAVGESYGDLSGFAGGSNNSSTNFVIVKYDSDLNLIKVNNMPLSLYVGGFQDVVVDKNNNYIAVGEGYANYDAWQGHDTDCIIVKYDSNLNFLAEYTYGIMAIGHEELKGITTDNSGYYLTIGVSSNDLSDYGSSEPLGSNDLIVSMFDSNLNLIKMNNLGGTSNDMGYDILINNSNYIIVGSSDSDLSQYPGGSAGGEYDDNFLITKIR
jgi:type IV pilus assembly protein PilA